MSPVRYLGALIYGLSLLSGGKVPSNGGQMIIEAPLDSILLGVLLGILKLIIQADLFGRLGEAPHGLHEKHGEAGGA